MAEYLREAVGEKRLLDYTRADANKFRDWLLARGIAGSSIARTIGTLRAVLNFAASEHALDFHKPFQGVQFDATAGVADREPVPLPIVRKVKPPAARRMMICAGSSRSSATPDFACPRPPVSPVPTSS
ncbi:hypothetical protein [Rhodobacter capsulatus]|uniref:hypothetical protein n=1 Tax=Rhodobacter capsulatus TaxID=1061 RepID=UPI00402589ED